MCYWRNLEIVWHYIDTQLTSKILRSVFMYILRIPKETPNTAGTIMKTSSRVKHRVMEMPRHLQSRLSTGSVNQVMLHREQGRTCTVSLQSSNRPEGSVHSRRRHADQEMLIICVGQKQKSMSVSKTVNFINLMLSFMSLLQNCDNTILS